MPKFYPATQTKITCKEQAFPEFPDMLFGKTNDGISFFDATDYLQKTSPSSNLEDFFILYATPISALIRIYGIREDQVRLINEEGHHLIDGNLVYLFIAFVEPNFWGYVFDRIHEMFSTGFCISDTYLIGLAKERLPRELMMEVLENGN